MPVTPDDLDGRLSQGWGGNAPNGVHLNVLLAARGSATAASIATVFTSPTDGFTPILACLGETQQSYVTLNPPTVILNKTATSSEMMSTLVSGAAQVGISQGVLDTVAEGLLSADQDTIILVSLWIDPAASDETAIKEASRQAMGKALGEAVNGRSDADRKALVEARDQVTHPFYSGR